MLNRRCFGAEKIPKTSLHHPPPFCSRETGNSQLRDGKTHKLFQHKLFGSHPSPPILGPQKKSLCASFSGKQHKKRDPHKLFRGDFRNPKRGPKRAIFCHKKFSLLHRPLNVLETAWQVVISCVSAYFWPLRSPGCFQKVSLRTGFAKFSSPLCPESPPVYGQNGADLSFSPCFAC